MLIKRAMLAAVAVCGWSLAGYAASAGPVNHGGASFHSQPGIAAPPRNFTPVPNIAPIRVPGPAANSNFSRGVGAGSRGFRGGDRFAGRGLYLGAPIVGYYGGDSCYLNCLKDGYGPDYCRVHAYNFCS